MKYPLVKDLLANSGTQLRGDVEPVKGYRRKRQKSPRSCAPGSFRTMTVNHDTKMVVCCPRGKYNKRSKRCKVGLIVQTKLKRRGK